jgi:hypothetical protein
MLLKRQDTKIGVKESLQLDPVTKYEKYSKF